MVTAYVCDTVSFFYLVEVCRGGGGGGGGAAGVTGVPEQRKDIATDVNQY